MSSSVPQLYYFSIRGYGEYIRLLLVDQGIKFDDHRFQYQGAEWAELKKTMLFGQMPCLKVDGQEIVQTGAIMRHLARVHGLNGSNEQEATFLDMFFEGVRDVRTKYVRYVYYDAETREQCVSKTLPEALTSLEKLFNRHTGDFVIGNAISYADYILFEELDVYNTLDAAILDAFPGLKAFWQRMGERPNLKPYLAKRAADKVWINAIDKI